MKANTANSNHGKKLANVKLQPSGISNAISNQIQTLTNLSHQVGK